MSDEKEFKVVYVSSEPTWTPVTDLRAMDVMFPKVARSNFMNREAAGVRSAKRVAKDRARKKAAKKHKQHMRRCGK